MSIHDIPTTRARAVAILGDRKLQVLEEAGMMVVEVELLKRMAKTLWMAPWPRRIDNDEYTRWYNNDLDPVWAEMERELREHEREAAKRESAKARSQT